MERNSRTQQRNNSSFNRNPIMGWIIIAASIAGYIAIDLFA